MSNIPVEDIKVPVEGCISPGMDDRNEWATHDQRFGRGGFRIVETIQERDAITIDRRYGTVVYVRAGKSGDAEVYRWTGTDSLGSNGVWDKLELSTKDIPAAGITFVKEDGSTLTDVEVLALKGLAVTGTPQDGFTLEATGGTTDLNMHMSGADAQYGLNGVSDITILPPLNMWDNPDKQGGVMLEVKPGTFEPMHAPSFLAYLAEEEEVVGKSHHGEKGHHDGIIWLDDIVWPSGTYIETKMTEKTYGIQEADDKDPNVSGGMDYLVAFRASFKGIAPEDGFIRIYLHNNKTAWQQDSYMLDKDGQPLVIEREYKQGDKLGFLDIMGIVNAKGLQEFTCHVMDSFANDNVVLTDRSEGATGLMIQALTKDAKTGIGLLEFEADTKQNILFSTHYMGASQFDMSWMLQRDIPVTRGDAGLGQTMNDGAHLYNVSAMRMGIQNKKLILEDDGGNICDFNFGKIFSAEKTQMLRGKDVTVHLNLTNKDSAFNVALVKWTGTPNKYTKEIYEHRDGANAVVFQSNWSAEDPQFIAENTSQEDYPVSFTFTVPTDANNYGIIIYPVASQNPLTLNLSNFVVDVAEPFYGYVLYAPELAHENYLDHSKEYKKFVQDNQGYAALRYTLNQVAEGLPMPVGMPRKGGADITLDPTVNTVSGSSATGGEGAIKFGIDGVATVSGTVRLWNGQSTDSNVTFWWVKVSEDGKTLTKIPGSDSYMSAPVGCKNRLVHLRPLAIDVEAGDRIALRASADKTDGAFIESTSKDKPMVSLDVHLSGITTLPTNNFYEGDNGGSQTYA